MSLKFWFYKIQNFQGRGAKVLIRSEHFMAKWMTEAVVQIMHLLRR